eukprot:1177353-Pyramimonas_sp.AAC.1
MRHVCLKSLLLLKQNPTTLSLKSLHLLRQNPTNLRPTKDQQQYKALCTRYKEATIAGLPSERQIHADLSAPVYAAVAVYLTAKKYKVCHRAV